MAKGITFEEAREGLRIDEDNLSGELSRLAGAYQEVADEHELAVADRDMLKLELDELTAEIDEKLRHDAAVAEEKITEPGLAASVKRHPKIKSATRDYLEAKSFAGRWGAMKDAYEKRASALNKLVDKQVSELYHLGIERGAGRAKARMGEAATEYVRRAGGRR